MKHGSSGVIAIPVAYRDHHNIEPGHEVTTLGNPALSDSIPQSGLERWM